MRDRGSWNWLVRCGVAACACAALGCGRGERPRFDIKGTVIYDGTPLPAGVIRFEPNGAKGNRGPVGIAAIVNGSYSTAEQGCQGAIPGPLVAVITGLPEPKPGVEAQLPLFSEWQTEVELTPAGWGPTNFDFSVPKQPRR